ncbi:MAG: GntR family transcriptional regulator [Crocinitomicaceae bacterium]|nr:GntR family transcriptional regulator [Crocinitomicaceae bacterium]NCA20843.1 GntR family transcriptional regulator [Crocinitomicaceae bacterium]
MQLGIVNKLKINRFTPPGAFLEDVDGNEVLLPNKYVEEHFQLEDEVDVFVFKDSENRIVATTEVPHLYLGDFRYLNVIHVNPYGAFVDWGLDKDLLVPFSEQLHRLEQDEKYLFSLQYDNATDRLYGTMRVKKLLEPCFEDLTGQEVSIMICEENALGISVIVNNRYDGLIFRNNVSKILPRGAFTNAYVRLVREDGKLDIQFEPLTFEKFDQASDFLLEQLQANGGYLPLNDHSGPDDIREELGMSKKLFKQAVGKLYKQQKITIEEKGIRLKN